MSGGWGGGGFFFFFNDPATTEIYTLSLHDALPILYSLYTTLFFAILVGSSFTGNVNACDQIGSSNNILNA